MSIFKREIQEAQMTMKAKQRNRLYIRSEFFYYLVFPIIKKESCDREVDLMPGIMSYDKNKGICCFMSSYFFFIFYIN